MYEYFRAQGALRWQKIWLRDLAPLMPLGGIGKQASNLAISAACIVYMESSALLLDRNISRWLATRMFFCAAAFHNCLSRRCLRRRLRWSKQASKKRPWEECVPFLTPWLQIWHPQNVWYFLTPLLLRVTQPINTIVSKILGFWTSLPLSANSRNQQKKIQNDPSGHLPVSIFHWIRCLTQLICQLSILVRPPQNAEK